MWKEPEYYDREKLYDEVWTEPVSKVAKRYDVSDVAIAKVCRKMRIPVPGRGYWAKHQSGQKLQQTLLPKFKNCPKVQRNLRKKHVVVEEQQIERLVPEAFTLQEQLLKQEASPEMKIIYDPEIKLTNQFVKNTKKKLKESKKRISPTYDYGRCHSPADDAFKVNIGPENIDRALAILQTLCGALKSRGYKISKKPEKPSDNRQPQYGYYHQRETYPIYVFMLDTYISFKISESSKKYEIPKKDRKSSYDTYEYIPTGNLCFEISDNPYESNARNKWKDGKRQRVENTLNDIIINMIKIATMKKEQEAQRAEKQKIREIEAEKQREIERLAKIENARIDILLKDAERLVKYNQVKEYIEVMTAAGKKQHGENYTDSDFSKWVEWAEVFIDKNSPANWELPKFDISEKYGIC